MNQKNSTTEEPKYDPPKKVKLPENLSSLRQKLYQKAKQEVKYKFYTLYDRIIREDTIKAAYELVRLNEGAAGIDGISFKDIEKEEGEGEGEGKERFLNELREELKSKKYKPQAVLRVYIPKSNGKLRPLGIPTIRDRVVQMATVLILEPIFEADFLDSSFGFRPCRSAHQALEEVKKGLEQGLKEVYDADLQSYFDSIPHDKLMKCLKMRISDRTVLKLTQMCLEAEVVERENGVNKPKGKNTKGTPQGGVISPLLSNIYLHWFDKVFHQKDGPVNWAKAKLVRYADDFVILARYQGEKLKQWIETKVEGWLGLTINREKTRTVDLKEEGTSLDFLGYTFRYDKDLYGRERKYLNVTPSEKSIQKEKDKIKELTSNKNCSKSLIDMMLSLNRNLIGWSNYFKYGYPRKAFREINSFVRTKVGKWLNRKSQRKYHIPEGVTVYEYLNSVGLKYL